MQGVHKGSHTEKSGHRMLVLRSHFVALLHFLQNYFVHSNDLRLAEGNRETQQLHESCQKQIRNTFQIAL